MHFEILGEISNVETFASGSRIRELVRLRRVYGPGRWRKRKGIARVRLSHGAIYHAEVHWYEAAGIGRKEFKIKHLLQDDMAKSPTKQLVVCVSNDGHPASLEKRKIYVTLRDEAAEKLGLLRIIDESGDDYLYPKAFFRTLALPDSVKRAVLAAA
jgi:hypothetical protein